MWSIEEIYGAVRDLEAFHGVTIDVVFDLSSNDCQRRLVRLASSREPCLFQLWHHHPRFCHFRNGQGIAIQQHLSSGATRDLGHFRCVHPGRDNTASFVANASTPLTHRMMLRRLESASDPSWHSSPEWQATGPPAPL